jgi:hypothetical protein
MKEINGTEYYSKAEMSEIIGCSIATINARILALSIAGAYLGRRKWYTADEMEAIATYRKPHNDK